MAGNYFYNAERMPERIPLECAYNFTAVVELMRTNHMTGKQCEDFEKLRKGYGYGLEVRTHIDKIRSGSLSPLANSAGTAYGELYQNLNPCKG